MIVIVKGANAYLTPDDVNNARQSIEGASVLIAQFESNLDATLQALKVHKGFGMFNINFHPILLLSKKYMYNFSFQVHLSSTEHLH